MTGTWTIAGDTITAAEQQITGTATTGATIRSIALRPSQITSYIAVALGGPLVLVHKAGDKTGAAARVGDSANGWGVLATAYFAVLALGAILAL